MNDTFLTFMKNTSYGVVFLTSVAYLGIAPTSVVILTFLVLSDVVTGVLKSATLSGWGSIRSSVMERGIIAKLLLILVPFVVALAGRGVGVDIGFFSQGAINVLVLSEAYSILGNIYCVRTGRPTSEFDAVAYSLNSIRSVLKNFIVEDSK